MNREQLINNLVSNRVALRATLRRASDDRLSRCASAMLALDREENGVADDVYAMGGDGDCVGLALKSYSRGRQRMLARFGFDADTFEQAVSDRISAKACWLLSGIFAN